MLPGEEVGGEDSGKSCHEDCGKVLWAQVQDEKDPIENQQEEGEEDADRFLTPFPWKIQRCGDMYLCISTISGQQGKLNFFQVQSNWQLTTGKPQYLVHQGYA